MKTFIIDLTKCVGCYNCQIACKDEHCGNTWYPVTKAQPDTGQFWCKVNQYERGTIPKVKVAYIPVICQHCRDAPCIESCKEEAIYRRPDGLVIINPSRCNGCRNCINACPYSAIYFNKDFSIAQKCTGCAHLLDKGWKEPRCADACPTQALMMVEEPDLKELGMKTELLHPEYHTSPRVYYINLPKKFITGTVYDPIREEVIEGASCTLIGNNQVFNTVTDGFGDFWFEGLETGIYSLKIESCQKTRTFGSIDIQKDINLEDIPLS